MSYASEVSSNNTTFSYQTSSLYNPIEHGILSNISFPKNQSAIMMAKLDRDGIAISNGPACGSGDVKPSPVLSEIGLDNQTNLASLRFSFGSTNTEKEVDYLLNKLELNLVK